MPPKQKRQTRKDKKEKILDDAVSEAITNTVALICNINVELVEVQKQKEKSGHPFWSKKEKFLNDKKAFFEKTKQFYEKKNKSDTATLRHKQLFKEFEVKLAIFNEDERDFNAEVEKEKEKKTVHRQNEKEESKGARPKERKCQAYLRAKEELKTKREEEEEAKREELDKKSISIEEAIASSAKELNTVVSCIRGDKVYVASPHFSLTHESTHNWCSQFVHLFSRLPLLISCILCQERCFVYECDFYSRFLTHTLLNVKENGLKSIGERVAQLAKECELMFTIAPTKKDENTLKVKLTNKNSEPAITFFKLICHFSTLLKEADNIFKMLKVGNKMVKIYEFNKTSVDEISSEEGKRLIYHYSSTLPMAELFTSLPKMLETTKFLFEDGGIYKLRCPEMSQYNVLPLPSDLNYAFIQLN